MWTSTEAELESQVGFNVTEGHRFTVKKNILRELVFCFILQSSVLNVMTGACLTKPFPAQSDSKYG